MLMAARRLRGIALTLLVLGIVMLLYPLSLKVAAKRSELMRTERSIVRAQDRIRYLQSEIAVRASMRQLEVWNAETFGYSAPTAPQYLDGERQLASLDRLPRPAGLQPVAPVLVAMASDASANTLSASGPSASAPKPAAGQALAPAAAPRTVVTPVGMVRAAPPAKPAAKPAAPADTVPVRLARAPIAPPSPRAGEARATVTKPAQDRATATTGATERARETRRRAERLAMIESQLLSPETLKALQDGTAAEARGGQRP